MADSIPIKILKVFLRAADVLDKYWMHTEGDAPNGDISAENMEKAIELLCETSISKEK